MTWTLLIALPLAALVALFAIRPLRRAIVTRAIFAGFSADEAADVAHRNARRIYRV